MVEKAGFEPTASRLRGGRSTSELHPLVVWFPRGPSRSPDSNRVLPLTKRLLFQVSYNGVLPDKDSNLVSDVQSVVSCRLDDRGLLTGRRGLPVRADDGVRTRDLDVGNVAL